MEAFELWAATGYMKKNPIEKLLRDGLSFIHSDGTNDVLLLKASRLLGEIKRGDPRYTKRLAQAAKGPERGGRRPGSAIGAVPTGQGGLSGGPPGAPAGPGTNRTKQNKEKEKNPWGK